MMIHGYEGDSEKLTAVYITDQARNIFNQRFEIRPHGEWVPGREISQMWTGDKCIGIDYEDFSCSCCGVVVEESTEPEWNFCPNCGADMRKVGKAE